MTDKRAKIVKDISPETEQLHEKIWLALVDGMNNGVSANLILGSLLSMGLDLMWMSGMSKEEAAEVFKRFANATDDYYDARVEELN